jgi:hypothetical protein
MIDNSILSFIHCRKCAQANVAPDIEVGLVAPNWLRVWCRNHDSLIADFELATPLVLRCDVCGQPIDEHHSHEKEKE